MISLFFAVVVLVKLLERFDFIKAEVFDCCASARLISKSNQVYDVQIIPVSFPFQQTTTIAEFLDFFGMYVLSTFDLPVCRVGLHFQKDQWDTARIIDASWIATPNHKVSRLRMEKYKRRATGEPINCGTLSVHIIFSMIRRILADINFFA